MNWEYQNFVNYNIGNGKQYGFQMTGEDPVVTDWNNREHRLCTPVGILTYGKGKIVFSSLPLTTYLSFSTGASNVSKKVLLNYMAWGADPTVTTFVPVVDPVDTSAVVGTNPFAAGTLQSGLEISLTQASKSVRIQYSAPAGYETVALRICTVAGKTVWTSGRAIGTGRQSVTWMPGKIAAGTYVLQVRAQGADRAHYSVKYSKFVLMSR